MVELSKSFYDAHIFVCTNKRAEGNSRGCCDSKGGVALRSYMKRRVKELGLAGSIRVNNAGCLDRCELGPSVVVYPEAIWYRPRTNEDMEEILQSHIIGGEPVERLKLANDQTEQD